MPHLLLDAAFSIQISTFIEKLIQFLDPKAMKKGWCVDNTGEGIEQNSPDRQWSINTMDSLLLFLITRGKHTKYADNHLHNLNWPQNFQFIYFLTWSEHNEQNHNKPLIPFTLLSHTFPWRYIPLK